MKFDIFKSVKAKDKPLDLDTFCEKYHIKLTEQQQKAVQTVDGPVLLLAVPGSGKTTVLVSRLGYMIYCKGIQPENILTLTYTVAATKDMAARFQKIFGDETEIQSRLEFRTINGICASIINYYGRKIGKAPFKLVTDEKSTAGLLSAVYQKVEGEYPTESDMKNVRTWIAYIKNCMLTADEIQALNEKAECNIADIYQLYGQEMKKKGWMDFDDQMVYAYTILRKFPDILDWYQEKYRYICVDEAQDTSKIQHVIIALLASKYENLFMVGDEDQSIYGFRAAYPRALLSFERQHPGAQILLMEENFRSNAKIVEAADRFIQKNQNRHEKHMKAARSVGKEIERISVGGRNAQYRYLLKIAEKCQIQTAILYRDNESILPFVDLLERNQIPYRMRNAELTFFTHRIVVDIQNIIRFAEDPYNTELFQQIYYKVSSYLNKQKALEICRIAEQKQLPVLETAIRFGGLTSMTIGACKRLQIQMECLVDDDASQAIQRIVQSMGYGEYLERVGIKDTKLFILRALARQENSAIDFVHRLQDLQQIIQEKVSDSRCPLILSTIHASKGLEYDRVYLLDVADGIFPENAIYKRENASEKEIETYEEERRLFYVGVTRAKEELYILDTKLPSIFQKEFLPRPKAESQNSGKKNIVETRTSGMAEYNRMRTLTANQTKNGSEKENKRNSTEEKPHFSREAFENYKNSLGEGLLVKHKKFGQGVIVQISDDWVQVVFEEDVRTLNLGICFTKQLLEIL